MHHVEQEHFRKHFSTKCMLIFLWQDFVKGKGLTKRGVAAGAGAGAGGATEAMAMAMGQHCMANIMWAGPCFVLCCWRKYCHLLRH